MKIVISGAMTIDEIPGLEAIACEVELVCAPDREDLLATLSGAEVLLGWNFEARDVPDVWHAADSLRWIHWCGVAVDTVVFPKLAVSDVCLTNARGVFDIVMAEYVLGYMLLEVKQFRHSLASQAEQRWGTGLTRQLAGTRATIIGVGSIGRETARLLQANGVKVRGVGRSARSGDPVFGEVVGRDGLSGAVSDADWVIGILPLTRDTQGYFDASVFAAMKPEAHFINLGRGQSVDEGALIACLESGGIAGAMLDVFVEEPLSSGNPLWSAPNLVISPHMSSYFVGYEKAMAEQFLENLARFQAGQPLQQVIDKELGFAAA